MKIIFNSVKLFFFFGIGLFLFIQSAYGFGAVLDDFRSGLRQTRKVVEQFKEIGEVVKSDVFGIAEVIADSGIFNIPTAQKMIYEGKLSEARSLLIDFNHRNPYYVEAIGMLASVYLLEGRFAKAKETLDNLYKTYSTNPQSHPLEEVAAYFYVFLPSFDLIDRLENETIDPVRARHFIRSQVLKRILSNQEYEKELLDSIKNNENFAPAIYQLAVYYLYQDDLTQAKNFIDRSIALGFEKELLLLARGVIHALEEKWSAAQKSFEDYYQLQAKNDPHKYIAYDSIHILNSRIKGDLSLEQAQWMLQGMLYAKLGFDEKALDFFSKAHSADKPYARNLLNMAMSYEDLGDFQSAENFFKQSLSADPELLRAYHNLGAFYDETNRFREAVEVGIQYIQRNPNSPYAYYNLGNFHNHLKEYDQAVEYFQKAINLRPDFSAAYQNLGLAFYDSKKYQQARSCFLQAIKLWPFFSGSFQELGKTYLKLNDHKKAEEKGAVATYIAPFSQEPLWSLGYIYEETRQLEKAMRMYGFALTFNPRNARLLFRYAYVLSKLKKYQEAVNIYERLLTIDPYYQYAYNNLGLAYGNLNLNDLAIESLKKEIQNYPQDHLAYFNLGVRYKILEDYQKAKHHLKMAIERNPFYSDSYKQYGIILTQMNKFSESVPYFEKAIDLEPDNVDTYYWAAWINHSKLRNSTKAYTYYEKALQNNVEISRELERLVEGIKIGISKGF